MPHTRLREKNPPAPGPKPVDFDELCDFLVEFTTTMLAMGSQTARMVRSAERIAAVFGAGIELMVLYRHAAITIISPTDKRQYKTLVVPFRQIGLNFDLSYRLNKLSWEALDHWLDAASKTPLENGQDYLSTLRRRFYELNQRPRVQSRVVCLMIGVASAAFCRLFQGDFYAMAVVFFSSLAAFQVRHAMLQKEMDARLAFFTAAFVSSGSAALAIGHVPSATPEVAVAASVLFLVPGVPLLNAVNDVIDGHTLMGISRGVHASILILCVGFGLAASILLTGFNVL